jgi:phosphoglycolate phosphatase
VKYRLVLFDFDGTLADSFSWVASHLNQAADRFRLQRVRLEEVEELRKCDVSELLKKFKVPFWKLPLVAHYIKGLMGENARSIQLFPGVPDVLKRLKEDGATLGVISSNNEANVRLILGSELASLVSYYECDVALHGKASRIEKVLFKCKIGKEKAIMIGDEGRDIEAAQKSGVDSGAVTWGYNHQGVLEKHHPTYVFHSMDEMVIKLGNS